MPAPADHQIRLKIRLHDVGVTQDVEHNLRNALAATQVIQPALRHMIDVHDVSKHRKQVILDTPDHVAIDEG